ncbi:DUF6194 family protein [Thioclava sp. FR2]|uniref:DUF6194 family protein n=1 Tax=Thioclava sp. FR2 TaxID=3445780 RepID=UPI003EBB2896
MGRYPPNSTTRLSTPSSLNSATPEISPHPVYGWMSWIAVLNPSRVTFATLVPLIDEAVGIAAEKFKRRKR